MTAIAALYVDPTGCYAGLPDVEPWCEARDARGYLLLAIARSASRESVAA